MYHKKYGRITFSAWLNLELEQTSLLLTVVCGILSAAACVAVRVACGSPYQMILQLGIKDLLPPVWLFSLLRFLSMLTVGCAAGLVLGYRNTSCMAEKYKGGMFFILLAVLELCWYPTVFYAGILFLAVLEAVCMVVLSVTVMLCFFRVSRFAGWILVAHTVWLIYLLILTCSILFRN